MNGGTGTVDTQYKYKGESLTISSADTVKRIGYTFSCWNTQRDGNGKDYCPNDAYSDDADLELYAKWNLLNYSIQLNLVEGCLPEGSNHIVYTIETDTFSLPIPTKNEHEFIGWQAEGSDEKVKTVLIEKGSTGNLSFTAVWRKLDRYTISYDVNGGDGLVESQSKLEGHSIVIAEPVGLERVGYTFECWNTKPDGSGTDFNAGYEYRDDASLELYAKWSLVRYTISCDLVDGSYPEGKSNPNDYTIETETFTLVNPEREGYRFLGWKESGSADGTANGSVSVTKGSIGNKSFVAVWKQLNKYTITYDLNGFDGAVPEQSKYEGDSVSIAQSPIGLSRKGYEFVCWNISPYGNGKDYNPGDVYSEDASIRLYAKWNLLEYTISYDLVGGTLPESYYNPTKYTVETDTFTLVNPEKENYEFLGWKDADASDDTAVEKVSIEKGSIGDKSFIAVWRIIPLVYTYLSESDSYSVKCIDKEITSAVIPSSYEGKPVTQIESEAFGGCSLLKNVVIPPSIVSIGQNAFLGCRRLSVEFEKGRTSIPDYALCNASVVSITIPDGVEFIGAEAFKGCQIKEIEIPDSLKRIGRDAFAACPITHINLPDGIESIDGFFGCSSLTEIRIPKSVKTIGDSAFSFCGKLKSVSIENASVRIGTSAFYGCEELQNVSLGNSVTYIGASAFSYCDKLRKIIIPSSVERSDGAFIDCKELSVAFADGTTSIPSEALSNGDGVITVSLPSSVISIGDRAFRGCKSLTSIIIPSNVQNIGIEVFAFCENLTSIEVEEENSSYRSENGCLIEIKSNAVVGVCGGLNEIAIPAGVKGIKSYAFGSCVSLTNVTIPDSVTSIEERAFYYCSSLSNMRIPSSVTSIGKDAFCYCSSLTTVIFDGTVERWNSMANGNSLVSSNCTVYCTDGTISK